MKTPLTLAAAAACFVASSPANADCQCLCIAGEIRPVCSQQNDYQPLCHPRTCPAPPPSANAAPPRVLPSGARCSQQQVYDEGAGEYAWQEVCEFR